ncbi:MAG: hypothetical protein AAGG56_13255 [Pseudomonadota bacterium]
MNTPHDLDAAQLTPADATNAMDFQWASQLSTSLLNVYKAGNMVLVLVYVGVVMMLFAGIAQPTGPTLWFLLVAGAAALIVPISLTWWRSVRPIQDLKKRVDEQAAFIDGVQDNCLRATKAMRSLGSEVIVKQDKFASAIKAARPFVGDYPVVVSWIDRSENLGSELARHAVLARDISYKLENAIRTGDADGLKAVAAELQQLVVSIESAPALPAELGASSRRYEEIFAELEASGALSILSELAAALGRVAERRADTENWDETGTASQNLIAEVVGELDGKALWATAPKLLGLLRKNKVSPGRKAGGDDTTT